MSLTGLFFLALGGLSVIIGIIVLSGFISYKLKKNNRLPPLKTNPVSRVRLPQPELYDYYSDNTGYYYREFTQHSNNNKEVSSPGVPANKINTVRDMRKAKPLRIEVVNYYGSEDDNNRYYYGN